MSLIEIDARDFVKLNKPGFDVTLNSKPAILLTGAHHAREFASIQMPMFSILRMLHGLEHDN
jgi:hypothetical protein